MFTNWSLLQKTHTNWGCRQTSKTHFIRRIKKCLQKFIAVPLVLAASCKVTNSKNLLLSTNSVCASLMLWSLCEKLIVLDFKLSPCVFNSLFWVIPQRLNFMCRRFGTTCMFHLPIGWILCADVSGNSVCSKFQAFEFYVLMFRETLFHLPSVWILCADISGTVCSIFQAF